MSEYKPELAKGEVLVKFLDKPGFPKYISCPNGIKYKKNFLLIKPDAFAENMGYEYIGDWEPCDDIAIFKVPVGKEKEAIKKLNSLDSFVEWAEQRDLTYERRSMDAENALDDMMHVRDYAGELSKNQYNAKLDEIISDLENMKEK